MYEAGLGLAYATIDKKTNKIQGEKIN